MTTETTPETNELLAERMKINEALRPHNLIIVRFPDGHYEIGSATRENDAKN